MKWRVRFGDIDQVEVSGETAAFWIFPNGQRAKKGKWAGCFFGTWEAAKEFAVAQAVASVNVARESVDYHQRALDKARALTRPEAKRV